MTKEEHGIYSLGMDELVFNVHQEPDGGYWTRAESAAIFTQGDTWDELCANVREVVDAFYDGTSAKPKKVRLHLVHDQELLVA